MNSTVSEGAPSMQDTKASPQDRGTKIHNKTKNHPRTHTQRRTRQGHRGGQDNYQTKVHRSGRGGYILGVHAGPMRRADVEADGGAGGHRLCGRGESRGRAGRAGTASQGGAEAC